MSRKAVIIGADISGPILAIQLKEIGYAVEVYEARSEQNFREGLFIGLSPNGLNVLRQFADPGLLKKDFTAASMQFYNQNKELIAMLDNRYQNDKYGCETIQIKRSDLNALVKKAGQERGITIQYGKKCVDVIETVDNVIVKFEDGTQTETDLLFGADGTFSVVRNTVFPDAAKPEYNRTISTGGYARLQQLTEPLPAIQMTFGEKAFFAYTVSNKGEIWWFNNVYRKNEPPREEMSAIMKNEIISDLLKIHKNDDPLINEIIRASHDFLAYPIYDIPTLRRWHSKRVCLLGDAAHAIAPHSGQGASLALEDTVCIVNCLKSENTSYEAFSRYQKLRQPRVEKIIRNTRKIGNRKSKPNKIATWFRDKMLGFFIKQTIKQMDWVYGYKV
jgi:2-polyprenyl-6-methoxyphenol hydroxylase-like FAD-dependent oxidoreductase